jgi:hypothetical protein
MRVRVFETPTQYKEFFTMKEAEQGYGKSIKQIKKEYKVERVYNVGYWDDVDKDYLKACAISRSGGTPRCLIN